MFALNLYRYLSSYDYFVYTEPKHMISVVIERHLKWRYRNQYQLDTLHEIARNKNIEFDRASLLFLAKMHTNISRALNFSGKVDEEHEKYDEIISALKTLGTAKMLLEKIMRNITDFVRIKKVRRAIDDAYLELEGIEIEEDNLKDDNATGGYCDVSDLDRPSIRGVYNVFKYTNEELIEEFGNIE